MSMLASRTRAAVERPSLMRAGVLLFAFLAALVPRIAFWWSAANGPLGNADTPGYVSLAATIESGLPYRGPPAYGLPGAPPIDLLRPPGYPLILQLLSPGPGVRFASVALLQCFLGAAVVPALIFLFAPRLGSRAALFAGLALAVDWVTIVHTPLVTADLALSLPLMLALAAFANALANPDWRLAALAGALLGAAVLVKPAAQVALPAFALVARPPRALLPGLVLGCVVVLAPWSLRCRLVHGTWNVAAIGTVHLGWAAYHASGENPALLRSLRPSSGTPAEQLDALRERSLTGIRAGWPTFLRRLPPAYARGLFGTARRTAEMSLPDSRPMARVLSGLALGPVLLVWLAALVGARSLLADSEQRPFALLLVLLTAAFILPALGGAYSRFRVPVVPEVCLLAGAGLARLGRRSATAA